MLWHSFIHPFILSAKSALSGHTVPAPRRTEDDWPSVLSAKTSSPEKTGSTPDFLYRQSLEAAICWMWTLGKLL